MRIAHLTDLHVLERNASDRRGADRIRLGLLCNGRRIDSDDRRRRVVSALEAARKSDADHLVITGDLTEDGTFEQFEALAEIFYDEGVNPERTTLVAGNHDAYAGRHVWDQALAGPLAAFRNTSTASSIVELGALMVLPVCTRMEQSFVRAAGVVGSDAREKLGRALRDPALARRTTLIAMHHPIVARRHRSRHWFDGLLDAPEVTAVLAPHREVVVLHGHDHQTMDLPIGEDVRVRSRGASAVVDHPNSLRVFELRNGQLEPAEGPARDLADARPYDLGGLQTGTATGGPRRA